MGPTRLSPSSAALWDQCPQRWWFRYVDGLPEPPPGEPAVLGTFVHRILELLLDDEPGARTLERARAHARTAWDETASSDDYVQLGLAEADARRFRQRAWSTMELYFEVIDPASVRPVARELEVVCEIAGVPFRGFIDLVEHHEEGDGDGAPAVIITDYKTGKPPVAGKPWSEAREAEKLLQPQWYAAALAELGEHRPVRARLLYLAAVDGPEPGSFRWNQRELSVDVTDEVLDAARSELRRRWDDMQAALALGRAEPSPGPLCGWCPYVEHCDVGQVECRRRWDERDRFTGERKLRADAPAVATLGLGEALVDVVG